jgi:Holliday junction resolvase RusA-like endonuclease
MKFTILGTPMPKQSARFRSVKMGDKTFVKSYQKNEVVQNERNMAFDIKSQLPADFKPYTEALAARIVFVFPPLSSWNKKQQNLFSSGVTLFKSTKPDVDNLQKICCDAMQGVVYLNDSQIVDMHCTKIYGPVPMIEIEIKPLT